jgi:hypothetical protein
MPEQAAFPTAHEHRAYMLKLKAFRESLSPREQRMLDAMVLAAYWPEEGSAEVQGYRLLPLETIYDEETVPPPLERLLWGKLFATL